MQYFDIDDDMESDEQKDQAIKILVNALNEISKSNISLKRGLNGAVMLRLFAPTYHYTGHRGNDIIHNKKEKEIRDQLFKSQKWSQLLKRIQYEQNKKNRKKDRKRNEKEKQNNQNQNINHQIKQQLTKISTTDLLDAEVLINESSGDVNNNKLAQNINNITYGEYDKTINIKQRIKRCIKECRKGRFKKGDDALNDGVIVDLNVNGNWNKTQSKFPKENKIIKTHKNIKSEFNLKQDQIID